MPQILDQNTTVIDNDSSCNKYSYNTIDSNFCFDIPEMELLQINYVNSNNSNTGNNNTKYEVERNKSANNMLNKFQNLKPSLTKYAVYKKINDKSCNGLTKNGYLNDIILSQPSAVMSRISPTISPPLPIITKPISWDHLQNKRAICSVEMLPKKSFKSCDDLHYYKQKINKSSISSTSSSLTASVNSSSPTSSSPSSPTVNHHNHHQNTITSIVSEKSNSWDYRNKNSNKNFHITEIHNKSTETICKAPPRGIKTRQSRIEKIEKSSQLNTKSNEGKLNFKINKKDNQNFTEVCNNITNTNTCSNNSNNSYTNNKNSNSSNKAENKAKIDAKRINKLFENSRAINNLDSNLIESSSNNNNGKNDNSATTISSELNIKRHHHHHHHHDHRTQHNLIFKTSINHRDDKVKKLSENFQNKCECKNNRLNIRNSLSLLVESNLDSDAAIATPSSPNATTTTVKMNEKINHKNKNNINNADNLINFSENQINLRESKIPKPTRSSTEITASFNKLGNYRPQSLINSNMHLSKSLLGLKYENNDNIFENDHNRRHNGNNHQHCSHNHHSSHHNNQSKAHESPKDNGSNTKQIEIPKLPAIRSKSIPNYAHQSQEKIISAPTQIICSPTSNPTITKVTLLDENIMCNKNERALLCNSSKSKIFLSHDNYKNKFGLKQQANEQRNYIIKQPLNTTVSAPSNIPSCIIKCENSLERIKCKNKMNITNCCCTHIQNNSSKSSSTSLSSALTTALSSPTTTPLQLSENYHKKINQEFSLKNNNNITKSKKYQKLITITAENDSKDCNDKILGKNNDSKVTSSQQISSPTTGVTITILNNESKNTSKPLTISSNTHENNTNLNDVQNFNDKNLVKTTTDQLLIMNSTLNNTVTKTFKAKSNLDVNLKNSENRKFNDLKGENLIQQNYSIRHQHNCHSIQNQRKINQISKNDQQHRNESFKSQQQQQHCLKIFVRNSSFSNKSISSDTNSAVSSATSDEMIDENDYYNNCDDKEPHTIITSSQLQLSPPSPTLSLNSNHYLYNHNHDNNSYMMNNNCCCKTNELKSNQNNCILHHHNNIVIHNENDGPVVDSFNSILNHRNNNDNESPSNITKLGCDGGIFWNNCFYSLESNINYCPNNNSNINYCSNFDMMSDYQYYKIMKQVKA